MRRPGRRPYGPSVNIRKHTPTVPVPLRYVPYYLQYCMLPCRTYRSTSTFVYVYVHAGASSSTTVLRYRSGWRAWPLEWSVEWEYPVYRYRYRTYRRNDELLPVHATYGYVHLAGRVSSTPTSPDNGRSTFRLTYLSLIIHNFSIIVILVHALPDTTTANIGIPRLTIKLRQ